MASDKREGVGKRGAKGHGFDEKVWRERLKSSTSWLNININNHVS